MANWPNWTKEKRNGKIYWYDSEGTARCGQNNAGKPCRRFPRKGENRCHIHAKSEAKRLAIAEPRGYLNSFLPYHYRERFSYLSVNPDERDIGSDINLLELRKQDLVELLSRESFDYQEAHRLYEKLGDHLANGNFLEATRIWEDLGRVLSTPLEDQAVWELIGDIVEKKRKLVQTESQMKSRDVVSVEKLNWVMIQMLQAFVMVNHIQNESERRVRYEVEIDKITGEISK